MSNTKGLLPRLPFYLLAAVALAACGGGGGGDDGGGGIVRPQCQAPAPLNPGDTNYGFLFPSTDFSSGQITLIDADDLGSKQNLSANGIAEAGSVAVAQTGTFQPASGSNPAIINSLKPAVLVYVNSGDVYRVDLNKNGAGTTPVALTNVGNVNSVCDASIVTVNVGNATADYYLYSVPPTDGCDVNDSSKNPAFLVRINSSTPLPLPQPIANAKPVETLADPATGNLAAIIALDKNSHLNAYNTHYDTSSASPLVSGTVTSVIDLFHALNIAFMLVQFDSGTTEIVRVEANSPETLNPIDTIPLLADERLTAATADGDNLYFALKSNSGYSIFRVALSDADPANGTVLVPTPVLPLSGPAGDTVVDLKVSGQHVVFELRSGTDTVGTLYSIDKAGGGSAQPLDHNVSLIYPFFTANGHLYYTVVSGGDLQARIATDTGTVINQFDRSAWFDSMLPADRPAGTVDPAQILLAAGYTGSGQTLSGAVLDSFPTAASSSACVTFNKAVGGQPVVTQHFNSLGTGFVTNGSDQARFAFDASDGRFVTVP